MRDSTRTGARGHRPGYSRMVSSSRAAKNSSGKKALAVVLAILLVLTGTGFAVVWWFQRALVNNVESLGDPFAGRTNRPTPSAGATAGEDLGVDGAMNFLVLGSDSRISAGDPTQWAAGAQRTDTMMLVHVPADRENVFVISIPRDSWVDIPGHGSAKINAAFSYGGPALTIETVENLTGVPIDHFVMTDFESFKTITDALGGVRMTLKEDLHVGSTVIPAGNQQLLTGEQALWFVRERKNLPRGDFDRVQRQQAWVRAMVAKMRNDGTLGNPIAAQQFLDTVTRSIAADDGLNAAVMGELRSLATDLGSNDIVFMTAPYSGTGTSPNGQSIVELNMPAFDSLMEAVRSDTVSEYIAANPGAFDTLPPVVN